MTELEKAFREGITPDAILGTSLGLFSASVVSDILDYKEAIESVINQAKAMERICPIGGMMAIIENERIFLWYSEHFEDCSLGGANFENHFVISGTPKGLANAEQFLKQKDLVCQNLPVSYGYHSPLIDDAEEPLIESTRQLSIRTSAVPVFSCMAQPGAVTINHRVF